MMEQGRHVDLIRHTDGLYSRLVQRQMLAADLGLVDEMSDCTTDHPSSTAGYLSAVASSVTIPVSSRLSGCSNNSVNLSLTSLVGSPDSVKSASKVSTKYGSVA